MFSPIEEIIAAIGRGEMVIMVDDEDRENEGDLILAAEDADAAKMGFVLRHSSSTSRVTRSPG
jgi:3,4-dihydroxy-2-butanone 4-phosphate synthase